MRHSITAVFLLFFTLAAREAVCLDTAPEIGKLAPSFELSDVYGKKVTLSEYTGKVILIHFWATWCAPCKAEMPSLNNLSHAFKNDGLIVLSISIDSSEKPVLSFLKKKELSFPVLMDKEQEIYFDLYGVLGLPTTILIDRDGVIREKIRGEREWDARDMKEKVQKLLISKKEEGK